MGLFAKEISIELPDRLISRKINESDSREIQCYKIYSLWNDEQSKTSFFLGCGHIDSDEYLYTFIRSEVDNAYKRFKFEMNRTLIIENNDIEPQVWKIWTRGYKDYVAHYRYFLYIPEESIMRKFNLK